MPSMSNLAIWKILPDDIVKRIVWMAAGMHEAENRTVEPPDYHSHVFFGNVYGLTLANWWDYSLLDEPPDICPRCGKDRMDTYGGCASRGGCEYAREYSDDEL